MSTMRKPLLSQICRMWLKINNFQALSAQINFEFSPAKIFYLNQCIQEKIWDTKCELPFTSLDFVEYFSGFLDAKMSLQVVEQPLVSQFTAFCPVKTFFSSFIFILFLISPGRQNHLEFEGKTIQCLPTLQFIKNLCIFSTPFHPSHS